MAIVRITDLSLRTIIGINDWEREKEQDIVINLEFEYDANPAIRSDDIKDTIDYKAIKQDIILLVADSRFHLVEKLAGEILQGLMRNPKIKRAAVKIDKPQALRFARSVSVEVEDRRENDK